MHVQGVKQLVCPSVVVGSRKIARSQVLVCAYCKHNELVDIGEKLVSTCFKLLKWLTSATNCVFLFGMPVVYQPHPLYWYVLT